MSEKENQYKSETIHFNESNWVDKTVSIWKKKPTSRDRHKGANKDKYNPIKKDFKSSNATAN